MTESSALVLSPDTPPEPPGNGAMTIGAFDLMSVEEQDVLLPEYDRRRANFFKWLDKHLERGVHYGTPPGCEPKRDNKGRLVDFRGKLISEDSWRHKETLYQAGARKLVDLFKFADDYQPDWDLWRMAGSPEGTICWRCLLYDRSGGRIAIGHGAMEDGEKKMVLNSRIKIAKKRALVDAVLSGVPCIADLFTQDLDDGTPEELAKGVAREKNKKRREAKTGAPAPSKDEPSVDQVNRLKEYEVDERVPKGWRKKIAAYLVRAEKGDLTAGEAGRAIGAVKKLLADNEDQDNDPGPPPDCKCEVVVKGFCAVCKKAIRCDHTESLAAGHTNCLRCSDRLLP